MIALGEGHKKAECLISIIRNFKSSKQYVRTLSHIFYINKKSAIMSIAKIEFIDPKVLLVAPLQVDASDDDFNQFMQDLKKIWLETERNEDHFVFIFDSRNFTPSSSQIFAFAQLFIELKSTSEQILVATYLVFPESYKIYLDMFFMIYTPARPVHYASSVEEAQELAIGQSK